MADPTNELYPSCANTSNVGPDGWNIGAAASAYTPWLHQATDWVPAFLRYIQDTWPSGGIIVSEFGWAEPYEEMKILKQDILYDTGRMMYYKSYMEAILMSLSEGVNVVGCLAWSIADNLEWNDGKLDYFVLWGDFTD